jgi:hypothetical protein
MRCSQTHNQDPPQPKTVNTHRPRHIRDIAHLYISRTHKPTEPARPLPSLLLSADDRCCLPGFHAANLAAGFCSKGLAVRFVETSGLLPNAGYFLSLSPEQYINWNRPELGPVHAGLAGIRIGFHTSPVGTPFPAGSREFKIFHLPPVYPEPEFRTGVRRMEDFVGSAPIVLLLEMGGRLREEAMRTLITATSRFSPTVLCILRLKVRAPGSYPADQRFFDLGSLPDWTAVVSDRVPTVLRKPDSVLARAYLSICESIMCRINQNRRAGGAAGTVRASLGS